MYFLSLFHITILLLLSTFITVVVAVTTDLPYTLGIRDSIMIAHSFHNHPSFGPAGKLHGATYTCDVEFKCKTLTPTLNWVMDIGKATELLSQVLSKYNLQNLDDIFPNKDILTTTEFMAKQIHSDLVDLLQKELVMIGDQTCGGSVKEEGNDSVDDHHYDQKFEGRIRVKLWESHKAWASYEADIE